MQFIYFTDFLNRNESRYLLNYLNELLPEFTWDSSSMRKTYSWSTGGRSYDYNGEKHIGKPIPPFLHKILEKVSELCGHPITHILANYYAHGGVGVPDHSDKEKNIKKPSTVATISLGASGFFKIQVTVVDRDGKPVPPVKFLVEHGSMSFMTQDFQQLAKHAILKSQVYTDPRFSLTFRWVEDEVLSIVQCRIILPSPIIRYIRWTAEEVFRRWTTKEIVREQDLLGVTSKDFVFLSQMQGIGRALGVLAENKCIAVILYFQGMSKQVEEHTRYRLVVPSIPQRKSQTLVVDFRKPRSRGRDVWTIEIPSEGECTQKLRNLPERKVLPMYTGHFDASIPSQPIKIEKFCELALRLPLELPPQLTFGVVEEVKNNNCWDINYEGGTNGRATIVKRS